MILVDFPSGGCVDDVVNSRTNHQINKSTNHQIVHFSARVCYIIRRTVFNMQVCLNHNCRYEHNQFERRDEKSIHQRQFFKIQTVFIFKRFSKTVKESYLQLLLNILYCTQNCKFYQFLETKICFVKKKLFNIFLSLCIYFVPKSLIMILENHSLKSFRTTCSVIQCT